jgi:hypothetical protein
VSNASKLVVPLLLVAAAAGGAYWYASQQQEAPPVTPTKTETPVVKPPPVEPAPVVTAMPSATPNVERLAATRVGDANADAAQGVRGRVALPSGSPAGGLPVFLLESAASDPLKTFLDNKRGVNRPPVASTVTAADGSFVVGVKVSGKTVDLRILSDAHPEHAQTGIKVRDGDWFDTGEIRLQEGLVVTGHVIDSATKGGVGGATVFLASSHQSHAMVATPGRERGIPAMTDSSGAFRFTAAPRQGLINLIVEAQGYASEQLLNQQVKIEGANDYTLEVEIGQPIAGFVVDEQGKPIANVAVNAVGLSSKTPQNSTAVTGSDGLFSFASLRTGPYQLGATSPQHAEAKLGLVMTGDLEVKLVMVARGIAKLQVLAANGSPVRSYRLGLKRYFENNPLGIANVPEYAERSVSPSDYQGDFAIIRGLPAGEFRFQITDSNHAKTLSPNFKVVEGGEPTEVIAQLTLGGAITGRVLDDQGRPVADAAVSTDMNAGLAADTQIFEIFQSMIPEKHSKSSTRTGADGRFRLPKLAFADYMLRVAHPNFCEGKRIDLKIETEGANIDVGDIALERGTLVEGMTMVAGMPTGQIKVSLSTPVAAGDALPVAGQPASAAQQQAAAKALFSANVVSNGDGTFKMLKRVPPGRYKVTASRATTGNPFDALLDMRETEREITIVSGADKFALEFNLSKR